MLSEQKEQHMNGNHVSFEGNLVQTPELQESGGGTKYARFSLARSYKVGEEERTTFVDCVAFGQQAENISASLEKGQRVIVEAHLNQSRWTTDEGQNRSKLELIADTVAPVLRWATAAIEKNARPEASEAAEPELVSAGAEVGY
jgi:single-strand DNA-binding protein